MSSQINEILALTCSLISIQSTTENEAALEQCIAIAQKELEAFTIERFDNNNHPSLLVHNQKKGHKHFRIILNAHLDVVPGNPDQFLHIEKHGKLFARGAYDMKAAAATMIVVFKNLAKELPYPIALQIVTDEETGSAGTRHQLAQGIRADFVIAGECGSNLKITNKGRGTIFMKLTAKGKSAHGAYPWLGDNAYTKLHKSLTNIMEAFPAPKHPTDKTTVTITRVESNNKTFNKIPEEFTAYLDIRYSPDDKNIVDQISKMLPKDIKYEVLFTYVPLSVSEDDPYIQKLQEAGKSVLSRELTFRKAFGGSDMSCYAELGIPGIEFGPEGGNQHDNNEWVSIHGLERYHAILNTFLLSLKA